MALDAQLHKLMSVSEAADITRVDSMDFVLNLEVLNQCAHACDGCFVRRKNNLEDVDLETALNLAQQMNERGLRFREVILSPTDIFSATNSEEILSDPLFHELMRVHPKTRITTTAMFENLDWERFERIFAILDNPEFFKPDMILEFLVPININKVLLRDPEYVSQFKRVLDYFENETPKEVDWSFVVNVHYDPVLLNTYDKLTEIVKEEYNTIIEFLPSFFRSKNDTLLTNMLDTWKEFVTKVVTTDTLQDITLTIADKNHNGFNTIVTNYKKGSLYISPFVYEQILFEYPEMKVDGFTAEDVLNKNQELIAKQFNYATETTECSGCAYAATCVGRNVLSLMEVKDIKDCVFPKDVLDMFEGTAALSPRVARCVGK
jgi:hypothetical protein